jgi:hypothetical protein
LKKAEEDDNCIQSCQEVLLLKQDIAKLKERAVEDKYSDHKRVTPV